MLYPEHALLDRIGAAARDGFAAARSQAPYEVSAAEFCRALDEAGTELVPMNAPAGDAAIGERGLAAVPGRESDSRKAIARRRLSAYDRSTAAPTPRARDGRHRAGGCKRRRNRCDLREQLASCLRRVRAPWHRCGDRADQRTRYCGLLAQLSAAGRGRHRRSRPPKHRPADGLLSHADHARRFDRSPRAQSPAYPATSPIRARSTLRAVFAALDALGYRGWVGCEYKPAPGAVASGTSAGLGWMRRCVVLPAPVLG